MRDCAIPSRCNTKPCITHTSLAHHKTIHFRDDMIQCYTKPSLCPTSPYRHLTGLSDTALNHNLTMLCFALPVRCHASHYHYTIKHNSTLPCQTQTLLNRALLYRNVTLLYPTAPTPSNTKLTMHNLHITELHSANTRQNSALP